MDGISAKGMNVLIINMYSYLSYCTWLYSYSSHSASAFGEGEDWYRLLVALIFI